MRRLLCKKTGALNICVRTTLVLTTIGAVLFGGAMAGAGYYVGAYAASDAARDSARNSARKVADTLRAWIVSEQRNLADAQKKNEDHIDALAIRLAGLQAEMMRINALGERLVKMADLDPGEFDFASAPATGGPESAEAESSQSASEIMASLDGMTRLLKERREQLVLLEEWLLNNEVQRKVMPSGMPVDGWVSSDFGSRTNPVTGKRQHHAGVDIPGDQGEDICAVAAGVVTRSERVKGYGNLLEIRHGDGYSTRYAHNEENLVEVGERVEKGQVIALLGSTGRTTGSHVHFEVRKDGDPIDPKQFVVADND